MDTSSDILRALGLDPAALTGGTLAARSPIDGAELARVREHSVAQAHAAITRARQASLAWRDVPAPRRGELLRLFGETLRGHKRELGRLVSLEAGKILAEGEGEVQEMIDICDFAVGLSRQLYGLTIASERPGHRMMETWHPLGVVGVISAFNFPVAVWSWNAALALVCGNAVVWKPSEKTPLTALACQALFAQAAQRRRCAGRTFRGADRRPRDRRGAGGLACRGPGVGHRLDPHGPPGRPARGAALRPRAAGAGRQQRHHRRPQRRPGHGRARHRLRRHRHGRPALHQHAPPDRARQRGRRAAAPPAPGLRQRPHRQSAGRRHAGRPADRPRFLRRDAVGAQGRGRTGRQGHRRRARAGRTVSRRLVCAPRHRRDAGPDRRGLPRDLRAHPLRDPLHRLRPGPGAEQCSAARPVLGHLHQRPARGRDLPVGLGLGLRHRQRQHRHLGRRDRRRVRRREETGGGRESGSDAWRNYMRRATNTINYSRQLPLAQGIKFGE